jgi:hypothetical protein
MPFLHIFRLTLKITFTQTSPRLRQCAAFTFIFHTRTVRLIWFTQCPYTQLRIYLAFDVK